jgi:hypothetical protein
MYEHSFPHHTTQTLIPQYCKFSFLHILILQNQQRNPRFHGSNVTCVALGFALFHSFLVVEATIMDNICESLISFLFFLSPVAWFFSSVSRNSILFFQGKEAGDFVILMENCSFFLALLFEETLALLFQLSLTSNFFFFNYNISSFDSCNVAFIIVWLLLVLICLFYSQD